MKLFVIWSEVPQTQISHLEITTPSNDNESQITGFHKIRDTKAANHRKSFSNKIIKTEIKWYTTDGKTLWKDPWKNSIRVSWK